jgi:hypothetical protein
MLLAFAFVAAPLLHRAQHAHGDDHHHHAPAQQRHGDGALEHQQLAFTSAPLVASPTFFALAVATVSNRAAAAPSLSPRWNAAQPQGP